MKSTILKVGERHKQYSLKVMNFLFQCNMQTIHDLTGEAGVLGTPAYQQVELRAELRTPASHVPLHSPAAVHILE